MTPEGRGRGASTVSLCDDSVLWGWGHLLPRGGHVLGDSRLHELLGFTSLPHLNPVLHLPKSKPSPPAPLPTFPPAASPQAAPSPLPSQGPPPPQPRPASQD